MTVNADNKSAITITSNPEYYARTKYIDIQYHYVREKTSDGTIEFNYIPIIKMAADKLTKALERVKFKRWVVLLGLQGYNVRGAPYSSRGGGQTARPKGQNSARQRTVEHNQLIYLPPNI
jgi:hypothetical protein